MVTNIAILHASIISEYGEPFYCAIVWPTFYLETVIRIIASIIKDKTVLTNKMSPFGRQGWNDRNDHVVPR